MKNMYIRSWDIMDLVEKQHNIKSEMLFELVYIKMAKIVP